MAKRKNKEEQFEYTVGSGNVYEDFGHSNPEEANAKADLAILISDIISEKGLTQQQAAEIMGIDQPKVSKITRGLLSEFTIERLMRFVMSLGFDIEIRPTPHKAKTSAPSIHVLLASTRSKQSRLSA